MEPLRYETLVEDCSGRSPGGAVDGPLVTAGTTRTANRLLVRAAKRAPGWSAVLIVATVTGAISALLIPRALAEAVDAALGHSKSSVALMRLAAVLAVSASAELLGDLAGASYLASTTAWLRHRLLGHVLALGVAGQRRFAAGDVLARLTGDTPDAGQVLPVLLGAVVSSVTAGGAAVALWLIDWRVALAFLIGLPPTVVFVRAFMVRASDLFVTYRRLQATIAARLDDALVGIRTIRASGTATQEIERILAPVPELGATGHALWRAQAQLCWQAGLLVCLLELLVIAVAGFGVTAGRVTAGELLAAAGYVRIALGAFTQVATLAGLAEVRAGAARVAEVLTQPIARTARPIARLPQGTGALGLRDVTLRDGEKIILDRLNLEITAGVSVAIVGRSGAGKTTLASLIGRLIDPDEGQVLLDGVPVTKLDPEDLHGAVAYAFERPALLGSRVHDAIAYGRPSASRSDVERAARAAQADGFIRRLPAGYDTLLVQAALSGGEAQRLGLARAIVQGGRVLVLDDATSSLDTATELQIQAALANLLRGRTCIVVAHRAAIAARADLVAWLDSGSIRALAPHQVLWDEPEYRAVFAPSSLLLEAAASRGRRA